MKTLFLSHNPHEVHLEFAKSINAKIKITNLDWFVWLYKKISFVGYFYPIISLIFSFFIKVKEDILLVDGGSSLYLAVFLKLKNPRIKIIYLDGDLSFYKYNLNKSPAKKLQLFFFKKIDAVISVSEKNKEYAKFLNIPIEVVNPYPKQIEKTNIERKNYGLYVGRLDPDKDVKRIVEFGLQCPYFEKFIIIGDGVYRRYIQNLSQKNKKLIYLEQREDVAKFYSECKFLVHIPDYDPHPCTTMEAALCGCFPIISKGIGTDYLFDDIFIVTNPEDFKEINEKVKYILENEKKAKKLLTELTKKFPTKKEAIKNFKKSFNNLT
jgi:glycosyltransferase involved in cell wall biosynthesis